MSRLAKLLTYPLLFNLCFLVTTPPPCLALPTGDRFQPNIVIGDGKNGNKFATWTQNIQNRPVDTIVTRIRKLKGSDTFLNFRFQGGETFENGRRAYIENQSPQTLSWQLNGEVPNNRPLLLQSYHGEVLVESVEVTYVPVQDPQPPIPPRDSNVNNNTSPPRPWTPSPDDSPGNSAVKACRRIRSRPPVITIDNFEPTGDRYSEQYRVEGTIQGQCIEEVGYYERGRVREPIRFPLDERFIRRQFQLRVDSRQRPEIRVYTADGQQEVVDLESELQHSRPYRNY